MNSNSSALNTMLIGVIVVATMYFAREVLMPVALAGILSFMLAPPVRMLQRLHVPRPLAVVLVALLAFAVIFALGRTLVREVTQLAEDLPKYQATIAQKIEGIRGGGARPGTLERARKVLSELDKQLEGAKEKPGEGAQSSGAGSLAPIPVEVHEPPGGPLQMLATLINPLLGPLATTTLIVVFVIFILIQQKDLRDRLIRLAGSTDIPHTTAALDDAAHRLSHLFLTQLAINAGFGGAVGIGLWAIGIPSAFVWGVLAGILRFVPFVGPILGIIFPLALAVSVGTGWSMALWTIALFVALEGVTGQVVEPIFEGRTTGLTPIAIIVAATFWAWLWGPIGLVLATPLTVILVVLGRHVEALKFFDILLGDEPALSEAQVLYQRILARDPAEAVEHAKSFMAAHSLSHYCDHVARPALALAHKDVERGVLEAERLEAFRTTAEGLFADITHEHWVLRKEKGWGAAKSMGVGSLPIVHADRLAASWRSEAPLVCIGAHSHLDGAAASAVAMLAETHGVRARVEPPSALAAANLAGLDLSGAGLVCLSYFDLKSPARAQYAARRIREKAPHAKLMLGFWTAADSSVLESMKAELNADYAVKDFHTAAAIILEEATTERPVQPEGAKAETPAAAAQSATGFPRPLAANTEARSAPAPG
jgi:predicted PurR-regulated permease PerM